MGNKATTDNVAADMSPPNYRAAVQRLRGITAKKDKIASVNGEIADIFAKAEGHKVNRKAAKIFVALDKLEKVERDEILRSLNGLAEAGGWEEESQDLVDKAEGTVVRGRFGQQRDQGEPAADDQQPADGDDDTDIEEAIAEIEKNHGAMTESQANAVLRARKHLQGKPDAEPYTGDNSDLAGEDDETKH